MAAILHLHPGMVHQLEVGLVDQGGGVQAAARSAPPQLPACQPAQLFVHQGEEPIQGSGLPLSPQEQQPGELALSCRLDLFHRGTGDSGLNETDVPRIYPSRPFASKDHDTGVGSCRATDLDGASCAEVHPGGRAGGDVGTGTGRIRELAEIRGWEANLLRACPLARSSARERPGGL